MMCFGPYVCAAAIIGLAGAASAQSAGDTTFGGGLSVLGATLEGTYQIDPETRVRGVLIGGFGYDDSETDDDGNTYEIDLSVAAAAVMVDFYPNGPGWRVSGGLLLDLSEIEATGTGAFDEPFEINGETFDGGEIVGEAGFRNQISPIVTTGYDYPINDEWIISGEIGAIFTGGFDIEATANSDLLQAEIDADADFQDLQSDARDIELLPYISVTVGFRF